MFIVNSILLLTHNTSSSTVTSTQTITSTATLVNGTTTVAYSTRTVAKKRGINRRYPYSETSISASIPGYASPCSGVVRYSSACSCLGVTATTVTAPAFTVTVTATKTVTVTTAILTTSSVQVASSVGASSSVLATSSVQVASSVAANSSVLATYSVQVASSVSASSSVSITSNAPVSTLTSCASALPTFHAAAYSPEYYPVSPFIIVGFYNSNFSIAYIDDLSLDHGSTFSLNAAGNLLSYQQVAAVIPSLAAPGYSQLYFVPLAMLNASGILPAVCQIAANNTLSCSAEGSYTALMGCGTIRPVLGLGSVPPENCYYEYPTVYPACVPSGLANSSVPATSTVPTTSTAPASTVTACANALPTFIIEDLFFGGVPYYGILYAINSTTGYVLFDSLTLISQASIFSLNAAGNLLSGQLVGVADPRMNGIDDVYFVSPDTFDQNGYAKVTCQISVTNLLSCTVVNSTFPLALDACGTSIQDLSIGSYVPHGCFGDSYFHILPVCTP